MKKVYYTSLYAVDKKVVMGEKEYDTIKNALDSSLKFIHELYEEVDNISIKMQKRKRIYEPLYSWTIIRLGEPTYELRITEKLCKGGT